MLKTWVLCVVAPIGATVSSRDEAIMAKIPSAYLDFVVALGQETAPAQVNWFATATLYAEVTKREPDGRKFWYAPWLITCRHNFLREDKRTSEDSLLIRLNLKSGEPKTFSITLVVEGRQIWAGHPDESVDIAAFPLPGSALRELDVTEAFLQSDAQCWSVAQMREAELSEGDGVYVLGYPMGIMSRGLQRAVCRSGCMARIRDFYDDQSQPFLIDAQVFPGNSGGLVITCPDLTTLEGSKAITKAAAIGIVTSVETHWSRGRLDDGTPVRVMDPAGIGGVLPMDRVVETIAYYRASSSAKPPAVEQDTPAPVAAGRSLAHG